MLGNDEIMRYGNMLNVKRKDRKEKGFYFYAFIFCRGNPELK